MAKASTSSSASTQTAGKSAAGKKPVAAKKKTAAAAKTSDSSTDRSTSPMMNTSGAAASSNENTANTGSVSTSAAREISGEDRIRMIQYAAYHIAEKDGFQSGREQDYWFQAEKQISDLFNGRISDSVNAH